MKIANTYMCYYYIGLENFRYFFLTKKVFHKALSLVALYQYEGLGAECLLNNTK